MNIKTFLLLGVSLLSCLCEAGPGGLIIKGALKSWDEIAEAALKASGKEATKASVQSSSRLIEQVAVKYGDDAAKLAMDGGVEVAERLAERGDCLNILNKASKVSPRALRAVAVNTDEMLKMTARYGNDILVFGGKVSPELVSRGVQAVEKTGAASGKTMIGKFARLPESEIPRVIGAVEKNPKVAETLLDYAEKGGKAFLDRLFKLNAKKIIAGGLSVAAIIGAYNATYPIKAVGESIVRYGDRWMAFGIVFLMAFVAHLGYKMFASRKKKEERK